MCSNHCCYSDHSCLCWFCRHTVMDHLHHYTKDNTKMTYGCFPFYCSSLLFLLIYVNTTWLNSCFGCCGTFVWHWTSEPVMILGACFDCTNWDVLNDGSLISACTPTTDYIHFYMESTIPTKTIKMYPNNKTYITKDIKFIMNERKLAFKLKDTWDEAEG